MDLGCHIDKSHHTDIEELVRVIIKISKSSCLTQRLLRILKYLHCAMYVASLGMFVMPLLSTQRVDETHIVQHLFGRKEAVCVEQSQAQKSEKNGQQNSLNAAS